MIKLFLCDCDGVLTNATYLVLPTGEKAKTFNTRDWFGMSRLHKSGCRIGIVSGDDSESVTHQARRAAAWADLFQGVSNKLEFVTQTYIRPHGQFEWDEVAYIGDDNNDIRLLSAVGYPACPADAVGEVQEAIWILPDGLVLDCKGGEGCVREFADLIYRYNGSEV